MCVCVMYMQVQIEARQGILISQSPPYSFEIGSLTEHGVRLATNLSYSPVSAPMVLESEVCVSTFRGVCGYI